MLKEDVESLGPVRSRDVIKAQTESSLRSQLEAEGKIILRARQMKNFSFDDLADTTFPFPVSSFLYRIPVCLC